MVHLKDKIAEIADPRLREAIAGEVRELKKKKQFSLVFETHQPEVILVPKATVHKDAVVAKRGGSLGETWQVVRGPQRYGRTQEGRRRQRRPRLQADEDASAPRGQAGASTLLIVPCIVIVRLIENRTYAVISLGALHPSAAFEGRTGVRRSHGVNGNECLDNH